MPRYVSLGDGKWVGEDHPLVTGENPVVKKVVPEVKKEAPAVVKEEVKKTFKKKK